MLSYRHAFHAGNHADMLKHFTLFLVLEYFNRKDKSYWYIDTHSGAGLYDLSSDEAQKVGEYKQGIALLEQADKLPAELAEFVGRLKQYCRKTTFTAALLGWHRRSRATATKCASLSCTLPILSTCKTICAKSALRVKCRSAKRTVIKA